MRVYFMRHGETEANRNGFLLGWTDQPLTESGVNDAEKAKAGFERANIFINRVYSSPLSRAIETARILSSNVPIEIDERLKEISFGEHELDYAPNLQGVTFPCPGGESLSELQTRVLSAWNDIIHDSANRGQQILVSTHGTVIRALLAALKNQPDIFAIPGHGNCCVSILEVNEQTGDISILGENVCFC